MFADLDDPVFQDDDLAREWSEARLWPDGPICPHCGATGEGRVTRMFGRKRRAGCFQCNNCREQFRVTVGTVMERSKIPLHIWLEAMHLLASSNKGMSTHQLHQMLGVSLKSTWFLMHRIREAMREPYFGIKMGGRGQFVQADETFVGSTTTRAGERRQRGYQEKERVLTLVDKANRKVRSFHLPEVNSATLRPILKEQIAAASWLMTDDARYYQPIGRDYRRNFVVNHNIGEYVSGGTTTNAVENYFSILKRGINGVYQHVSATHLKRYVGEFDFRYNNRIALGVDDMARTEKIAKGAAGRRLTYQRTRQQPEAEASEAV
jgi:transposase-like protein